MQHTTQGMVHDDSTTEAPDMDMIHHESTMAMMHHETTTSDNEEEDALDELGEMEDHGTTEAMMHHEGPTTTDSVQTTAIDEGAADALDELDEMNHSPESTTASNDHQATNTPASDIVTEATTTADEEIAEDVGV